MDSSGVSAVIDVRTDEELARRAADGDRGAFEDLYRRHVQVAWRVAQSVTRNAHDASDAVGDAFLRVLKALQSGKLREGSALRPYLLAATRNAAIDITRRRARVKPAADVGVDDPTPSSGLVQKVVAGEDAALALSAFRRLPERYRVVLGLTEVQGMSLDEAGQALGLSANAVAQLAFRARARLREAYLQAHLGGSPPAECHFAVGHLGAYVGGGLSARDMHKVDQHLAACDNCRRREAELAEVGSTLRRAFLPVPFGLAGVVLSRWQRTSTASSLPVATSPPAPSATGVPGKRRRRAAGATVAAAMVGGALLLLLPAPIDPALGAVPPQASPQPPPPVILPPPGPPPAVVNPPPPPPPPKPRLAPQLVVPAQVEVAYSDPLTVAVVASDADTDPAALRFEASGLPQGLTLTQTGPGAATVAGTATGAAGSHAVEVSVVDADGLRDSRLVRIDVVPEEAYIAWPDGGLPLAVSLAAPTTLRALVRDAPDGSAADITRAAVVFEVTDLLSGATTTFGPQAVSATGEAVLSLPERLLPGSYSVRAGLDPAALHYRGLTTTSQAFTVTAAVLGVVAYEPLWNAPPASLVADVANLGLSLTKTPRPSP